MLYLFLGADDFTKKQEINSLVKEKGADLVMFGYDEEVPTIEKLLEADLFSKPKVFVLNLPPILGEGRPARSSLGEGGGEGVGVLNKLISSPNHIVVSAISLDKRKKENKDLLANSKIIVKEFTLPHGSELNEWILNKVTSLAGKISQDAVNELAVRLGRDEAKETKFGGKVVSVEEVYNLWQTNSEIGKLIAFAKGREILKDDVIELVSENGEVDALQITNAIAEKNRDESFALIGQFLKQVSSSDEKAGIIQLNALLSEQFRNVAMVQAFMHAKATEAEILEKTQWKSGRLFIMRKIAARFKIKEILELLEKLNALDTELKSSQLPGKVLLDLILSQILI